MNASLSGPNSDFRHPLLTCLHNKGISVTFMAFKGTLWVKKNFIC